MTLMAADKDSLVAGLAQRLKGLGTEATRHDSSDHSQPLILENRVAQTKSVHLVVIWDFWADMASAERATIIREAAARSKHFRGSSITLALGVTSDEALRSGFLPFAIVATHRQKDPVSSDALAHALAKAPGVPVRIGDRLQLRFPTLDMAENAYRQLSQEVPGPYWAIVQDQTPAAD
jgi:hypothetical protein